MQRPGAAPGLEPPHGHCYTCSLPPARGRGGCAGPRSSSTTWREPGRRTEAEKGRSLPSPSQWPWPGKVGTQAHCRGVRVAPAAGLKAGRRPARGEGDSEAGTSAIGQGRGISHAWNPGQLRTPGADGLRAHGARGGCIFCLFMAAGLALPPPRDKPDSPRAPLLHSSA